MSSALASHRIYLRSNRIAKLLVVQNPHIKLKQLCVAKILPMLQVKIYGIQSLPLLPAIDSNSISSDAQNLRSQNLYCPALLRQIRTRTTPHTLHFVRKCGGTATGAQASPRHGV